VSVLQIFHVKDNVLSGTIPPEFGNLPFLSWFDVSQNHLHGTIPTSFGKSTSLEDFRLNANMLYGDIPHGLCTNQKVNGGATKQYGCDGIVCPRGTYSVNGQASNDKPCVKCPEGRSNLYLGRSKCYPLTDFDILTMLYEATEGNRWPQDLRENWGDDTKSFCDWGGIDCNSRGEMTSFSLPLFAAAE